MNSISRILLISTYSSCFFPTTSAAVGQVLSSFIYTHHGERTPFITDDNPELTPLGAQQAWQAGVNMRQRYLQPVGLTNDNNYQIRDISSTFLDGSELNILSSADEYVTASAQAFMQGLFPPLQSGGANFSKFGEAYLADGSVVTAPLNGYQYPNIVSASPYDLRSIYVKATDSCPNYSFAMMDYTNSTQYLSSVAQSQGFYDSLKQDFLNGIFVDSEVGYNDAYYIWDYLSYSYIHNTTVARKLSDADRLSAQIYATDWMFSMYANSTTDNQVGTQPIVDIAGRTLAAYILQSFMSSIRTGGLYNKMSLVFGDYKAMMSLAALAGLMQEETGIFFNVPAPGSSMIFELYTYDTNTTYPSSTDMFVRFFYRNGTDQFSQLIQYYPFRESRGSPMTWSDFVAALESIMIADPQSWCNTCGSASVFCLPYTQNSVSGSMQHNGLQPAIAGAIGAVSALVFIGFVIAAVMLLGGVRLHRRSGRLSELGGFKGTEKLASDQDLTMPNGRADIYVNEEPKGHERVGSWELREPVRLQDTQAGIDTAAFGRRNHCLGQDETNLDPYGIPVKTRDTF